MLIKWGYANAKAPKSVSIYYRNINEPRSWKEVQTDIGGGTTEIKWTVSPTVDGAYVLKLVANGKDDTLPQDPAKPLCYLDGDIRTGISRDFRILTDRKPLPEFTDKFPPNAAVMVERGSKLLLMAVFVASLLML